MRQYIDRTGIFHKKPAWRRIHWRPSVYGVLENEKGEWCMVQPSWTKKLDLPGGGIKPNETFAEGLAREFYEETGYKVKAGKTLFTGDDFFLYGKRGPFCHTILVVYKVELISPDRDAHVVNTFEDGYEIEDMVWVHPDDMTEEMVQPPVWKYIQSYRHG